MNAVGDNWGREECAQRGRWIDCEREMRPMSAEGRKLLAKIKNSDHTIV